MNTLYFGAPRESLSGAIFLIGLAILFTFGWFWPGILVLLGITALTETLLRRWEPDEDDIPLKADHLAEPLTAKAPVYYPARCPSCGAAAPEIVSATDREERVRCAYCQSTLQPMAHAPR